MPKLSRTFGALAMKTSKGERNVGVLNSRKTELIGLIRNAKRERTLVLIPMYAKELKVVDECLDAVRVYGGEAKPMRTPWKSMNASSGIFEDLGKDLDSNKRG